MSVVPDEGVHQGDTITINITDIATDSIEYNVLTLGGRPCTISNNTSTIRNTPNGIVLGDTASYSDGMIECTVPDIQPGAYSVSLHVAGKGWAYSSSHIINIYHSIGSVTLTSGSAHGGLLITIPILGLHPNMIGHTTVTIGNTPCTVQDITLTNTNPQTSELTCITRPPINDGYSSLLPTTAKVYWSLQHDFYGPMGQYEGSEPSGTFSSAFLTNIPVITVGTVMVSQYGISGNNITDQAIVLDSSHLKINNFVQYSNATSFLFEGWFKSDQFYSDGYTVLASSYNIIDEDIGQGFILTINPCSRIELWLATGHSLSSPPLVDCSPFDCLCNGYMVYNGNTSFGNYDLPKGVWNKIISQAISTTSNWFHVAFGFQTNSPCISGDTCTGHNVLYVNGEKYSSTAGPYSHANMSEVVFGSNGLFSETPSSPSLLYPFKGSIDELSYYRTVKDSDIISHYHYGSTGEQPVWVSTEYTNGVSDVPGAEPLSTLTPVYHSIGLYIDWDNEAYNEYHVPEDTGVQFQWTE